MEFLGIFSLSCKLVIPHADDSDFFKNKDYKQYTLTYFLSSDQLFAEYLFLDGYGKEMIVDRVELDISKYWETFGYKIDQLLENFLEKKVEEYEKERLRSIKEYECKKLYNQI